MKLRYQRAIVVLFFIYIIFLIDFTLINENFGRNVFNIFSADISTIKEYIKTSLNFVPFKTILLFFNGFGNGAVTLHYFVLNIVGNIVLLAPLSFFVPRIFKKADRFYKFLPIVLCVAVFIELAQLALLTGSCDIDDVILNVFGASLFYLPLNRKRRKN